MFVLFTLDPLRSDVKEAVATATRAGVYVRMVTGTLRSLHTPLYSSLFTLYSIPLLRQHSQTKIMSNIKFTCNIAGDNIHTACAIARQCGILTPGGVALEGPEFRRMTPRQLDEVGDNTMNYLSENIRNMNIRNIYHIIPNYDIIPDICVNSILTCLILLPIHLRFYRLFKW